MWAAIIAYVSWPAYAWLQRRFGDRTALSSSVMTFLVGAAVLLPLLWLAASLQDETVRALGVVREYLTTSPLRLPEALGSLPGAQSIDAWLQSHTVDSKALEDEIARWTRLRSRELLAIAGGIGRDIAQFVFCLVTLFFLYREAETLLGQIRSVSRHLLGDGVDRYFKTIGEMVRAVVYGGLMTAFVQGAVAGFGYWIIGVEPSVLLGALTILAAFLPVVGTFAVFGPVSASLFLTGRFWPGLFVLLWGIILVHPIDNVMRPLVVSSVTRMPFLLSMFGVLGGLVAFGFSGIFIGPVSLAVGLALWKELVAKSARGPGDATSTPQDR